MRASGGTDALKPQTPRPIDTVSTKRTERTALEGRMAASASFADARAPPPEDRLWPRAALSTRGLPRPELSYLQPEKQVLNIAINQQMHRVDGGVHLGMTVFRHTISKRPP